MAGRPHKGVSVRGPRRTMAPQKPVPGENRGSLLTWPKKERLYAVRACPCRLRAKNVQGSHYYVSKIMPSWGVAGGLARARSGRGCSGRPGRKPLILLLLPQPARWAVGRWCPSSRCQVRPQESKALLCTAWALNCFQQGGGAFRMARIFLESRGLGEWELGVRGQPSLKSK